MEQVETIRNRINKKEKKSKLLSFLSFFMAFLSIILGIMIYMKKDENGTFLNENFNVSVNFENFNSKVNKTINNLFKFEFETSTSICEASIPEFKSDTNLSIRIWVLSDETLPLIITLQYSL